MRGNRSPILCKMNEMGIPPAAPRTARTSCDISHQNRRNRHRRTGEFSPPSQHQAAYPPPGRASPWVRTRIRRIGGIRPNETLRGCHPDLSGRASTDLGSLALAKERVWMARRGEPSGRRPCAGHPFLPAPPGGLIISIKKCFEKRSGELFSGHPIEAVERRSPPHVEGRLKHHGFGKSNINSKENDPRALRGTTALGGLATLSQVRSRSDAARHRHSPAG